MTCSLDFTQMYSMVCKAVTIHQFYKYSVMDPTRALIEQMPENARRGGDGEGDEPSGAGSSSRGRDLDSDRKKSKKRY